jgi:hypothetical protein
MPGANYGLNKGFLLDVGATFANVKFGRAAVQQSNTSVTSAGAGADVLGLFTEDVDPVKAATGKVTVGVALTGLHRAVAGAAIARRSKLTTDSVGRVVAMTRAAAGVQPAASLGIALTPAAAAGDIIDVLLTPGATY